MMLGALLLAAIAPVAATAGPVKAGPPNIILISIDTLRADHLGCYGYARPTSPNLDALARESVLFEDMTAASPKTAPSHMSLFTGLHPSVHGIANHDEGPEQRLSADIPTLATLLKRAGYRTAAYTAGGNVRPEKGFDQGFDGYVAAGNAGLDLGPLALEELARGKLGPFFLFLHTYEVHDPYTPPPQYARLFVDPGYAGRITTSRSALAPDGGKGWAGFHDLYWQRVDTNSPADVRHLKDLYDAGIRGMDDRLGRLLDVFKRLGLQRDSVLVFLSDHGEEFGEHGRFTHNSLYQEVLHVPLILRLPGVAAGRRIPGPVGHVDVMASLLELAGVKVPAHVQGSSLVPLLNGEPRGRFAFSEWPSTGQRALRIANEKYLEKGRRAELYDLATDPAEKGNLKGAAPQLSYSLRLRLDGLTATFDGLRARFRPGPEATLDAATREQLEALGYVAGH